MAIQIAQPDALARENTDLKALQQISFENTIVDTPRTLQDYVNIAKLMAASGFFGDVKNAQQAVAVMVLGAHFGLSPVQALTGVHIVKGKPMLHYSVILSKVRQHPDYDYEILEHTDKSCSIKFLRRGQHCGTSTFTTEDAKKAGTQNMEKMPRTMLLARAASNGVKWYCPDVLNGMPVYTQGEVPEENDHSDIGASNRDRLKAELTAKIAVENPDKANAILAEGHDVEEPISIEAHLTEIGVENIEEFLSGCKEKGADPETARQFDNAQAAYDWVNAYPPQKENLGL